MAKPIVVSQEGLRIMIDPDDPNRKPKPIVEYRLTPEEIEKRYGHIKGTGRAKPIVPGNLEEHWDRKKRNEEGEDDMKKIDVDVNEILEICRVYGTGKEGCTKVADHFGWSLKRAENQVFNKKIRRLLEEEKKQAQQEAVEIVKSAVEEEKAQEEKAQELKALAPKLSKVEVMKMKDEGKSIDEIVDYFSAGWNGKLQLLKAKIILFMSDKKLGGPKKHNSDIEQSEINSHEDHPDEIQYPVETEQYPDLKAAMDDVIADVNKKAAESAKRITLNNAREVDEMMEMVPTPNIINKPVHYTSGGIETTDYIQAKLTQEEFEGFCKGVILQYISRSRLKGGIEDLKKAQWYLDRIIKAKEAM